MSDLFPLFLFIHILTAIIAFGPTFTFSLIGKMGSREPQHVNFATRVTETIGGRVVLPAALTMPVSGVLMIWSTGIDWTRPWLIGGVALWAFAVAYSVFVQLPAVERLVALTATPPPPGAGGGGPSPEVLAVVRRIQRGRMLTGAVIVTIVALMVIRPGS